LPLELYENLKNEAIKIISILQESLKKKKNELSSFSNSSSINYSSNSSIYSSELNSSNNIDQKNSSINIEKIDKKETNIVNKSRRKTLLGSNLFGIPIQRNSINNISNSISNSNIYDDYYKVNIKDIKFIVYDYNKDFYYEKIEEKISQVEFIINDYMVNQKIYPNEDEKYPNININLYNSNNSSKENNKNDKNKEKKKRRSG
jgi:hypothetical protein